MRNKRNFLVVLVIILLIVSSLPLMSVEVFAKGNDGECKSVITENLKKAMDNSLDNDIFSVWLWYKDIDTDAIESKVKEKIGYGLEDLSSDYQLKDYIQDLRDGYSISEKDIENFVIMTEQMRNLELSRVNEYKHTKRDFLTKEYIARGNEIKRILNISSTQIIFESILTPSMVVKLTKEDICKYETNANVTMMFLYDNMEYPEPIDGSYMNFDEVTSNYGLTGKGVNVLVNDHGVVRSDAGNYSSVLYPDKVRVVYNQTLYYPTNTLNFPGTSADTHPNHVVGELQSRAPDTMIYSVGYGCCGDIEWTIVNKDIDFINASVNYGADNYNNSPAALWFDYLVDNSNIQVLAACGNSESWQPSTWPNVVSPASAFNTIGVGAYYVNSNDGPANLYNFTYSPILGATRVNYKPDVVSHADNTSSSTPILSSVVALMIQLKPSLSNYPAAIKAILMASCHEKAGGFNEEMSTGLTQRQGAGVVDAYKAICIVAQGHYSNGILLSGSQNIDFISDCSGSLNVSMAWTQKDISGIADYASLSSGIYCCDLLSLYDNLEMEIRKNGVIQSGAQNVTNAGKQMAYLSCEKNDSISVRMQKSLISANPIPYACAWSTNTNPPTLSNGLYKLKNKYAPSKCLQSRGMGLSPVQWAYSGSTNQIWKIIKVGDYYQISPASNTDYLLTEPSSVGDGVEVSLQNITATDQQLWNVEYLGNEGYYISPKTHPDKALEVRGPSTLNGAVSQLWSVNLDLSQHHWDLEAYICYGDLDYNAVIDNKDLLCLRKYVAGLVALDDYQLEMADVYYDGNLDNHDILLLSQYITGYDVALGP